MVKGGAIILSYFYSSVDRAERSVGLRAVRLGDQSGGRESRGDGGLGLKEEGVVEMRENRGAHRAMRSICGGSGDHRGFGWSVDYITRCTNH